MEDSSRLVAGGVIRAARGRQTTPAAAPLFPRGSVAGAFRAVERDRQAAARAQRHAVDLAGLQLHRGGLAVRGPDPHRGGALRVVGEAPEVAPDLLLERRHPLAAAVGRGPLARRVDRDALARLLELAEQTAEVAERRR